MVPRIYIRKCNEHKSYKDIGFEKYNYTYGQFVPN